jgi:RimJ/RimL family protein N-acetyltransferase
MKMDALPLDTARLHLRPPTQKDIDAIVAIADDWEVLRQTGRMPHPYTADDARFFLDHVVPNEPTWAITWKQTASLIGIIGLAPSPDGQSAEIGYYLGRDHWGKGVATEAARAIIEVAFESFGYRKLVAGYFTDNLTSGRVLAKLGFVVVGRSNHACRAEGRSKPSIDLQLTRSRGTVEIRELPPGG